VEVGIEEVSHTRIWAQSQNRWLGTYEHRVGVVSSSRGAHVLPKRCPD